MSKSKGEFLTVSLLESKGYDPIVYRFYCLQSHYRKQLLFTFDNLDSAKKAYDKLKNRINALTDSGDIDNDIIKEYQEKFKVYLENDLNTANAITVLYDVLKSKISDASKKFLMADFDKVLSIDLLKNDKIDQKLEDYIKDAIIRRNEAKRNKDYQKADEIRNELLEKNIILKDTREGTIYEIK